MATSLDSTEGAKRFSTISRDSCIVAEDVDVYKITESNSTSGYSTGLSDSCCNDKQDDDTSCKPLTDESIQDSVGPCDSEDAFSLQESCKEPEVGMEVSDVATTETEITALCLDSTSEALCETIVEDATLTEIHDLLMSPEETQSPTALASEDKENKTGSPPETPNPVEKTESSVSATSSVSTPEKKLRNSKSKPDLQRSQRSSLGARTTTKKSDEIPDRKKQIVKSPKKNVMSKIKAMIEATSCKTLNKNKPETAETKRVASTPKKSRWEAVTSKIAASLAEEKTKPKPKREIKSRVDTNLALARHQAVCRSPRIDSRRDRSMSPASVASRDKRPLSERNSAPGYMRDDHYRETKNTPKSPRPGKPCITSRSTSPVAASESSTTSISATSHQSRSKIAQWKGSSSTVASSIPPVKKQASVPPTMKQPLQPTRTMPTKMVTRKPTSALPKIRVTHSNNLNTTFNVQSPGSSATCVSKVPEINKISQKNRLIKPAKEQHSSRGTYHSAAKPARPPLWLSKAELTQEIQHLGNLCETRTKELNRLKMQTKHVTVGFDAFAALLRYLVEDMNALSVPMLAKDLDKTLKQLELAKQDLAFYEREVEEMKAHHCQELNDLSNKLFEVYQTEVSELTTKHQEELSKINMEHQQQVENISEAFGASSDEIKTQHEKLVQNLEQELIKQREEFQMFQEREIKDLEERHTQSTKVLREHIEQLQKKCDELKQHSMSMEDAMRKDTDSKLQWVTARKVDLEKEVESLKAVLEMKNKELHSLRVQNLEMEKQLEELPLAREKIKMLQARAEDLEALMVQKTKVERKLSNENQLIKDTYEKEAKMNKRLSMENEELQWRLRQAEQSLISDSLNEITRKLDVSSLELHCD